MKKHFSSENYTAECDAFDHGLCFTDVADLGLLRVSGADAATFLHNQLSTNVSALMPGQGQYSTWNSPKGRMQASFFLWRQEPSDPKEEKIAHADDNTHTPVFFLLLAADLSETIHKRLSMYVLRAKVTLENISASCAFPGLCGAGAHVSAHACLGLNSLPQHHHTQTQGDTTIVALSPTRLLLILPSASLPEHTTQLNQSARPVSPYLWQRATILDGIPLITAATADRLIPQSANWDALGGLDFQKGCYPGQEIVARTRYLGRIKERLYLAHCDDDRVFAPATPLYSPAFGTQACGLVVNAAPDRQGHIMLVSLQTTAADNPIHASRPDGSTLTLLPLPYELPAEMPPKRIKL